LDTDGRLRVRLSADYQRLEFLRVLRSQPHEDIPDPDDLLTPEAEFFGPATVNPVALQSSGANDG
jgi:rod shape-determining protein MreC